MIIGSLFSGIGGLELGLERAGVGEVVWQVEINNFCRSVLAKHWPGAKRYEDVRLVGRRNLRSVDVVCGGFPCQDLSSANHARRGLEGEKSGLWFEYRRIVSELKPRFVVVENVFSGRKLWLPTITQQLAELGYCVFCFDLTASQFGAPHQRRRLFVVGSAPNPLGKRRQQRNQPVAAEEGLRPADKPSLPREAAWPPSWPARPEVRGVDDGVPNRSHRLRALGNAVVPVCAEAVGRSIRQAVKAGSWVLQEAEQLHIGAARSDRRRG